MDSSGYCGQIKRAAYVASTANNVNVTTIGMLAVMLLRTHLTCSGQTLQPDTRTVNNNVQLLYEGNANLASCTLFCVFILSLSFFSRYYTQLFFAIAITFVFQYYNHTCFSQLQSHLFFKISPGTSTYIDVSLTYNGCTVTGNVASRLFVNTTATQHIFREMSNRNVTIEGAGFVDKQESEYAITINGAGCISNQTYVSVSNNVTV